MKLYKIILLTCFSTLVHSQSLTTNKGTNSILYSGFGIDLDVAKEKLQFNLNNYDKVTFNNRGLLIGGNVNVKNTDLTGNLFSKGYFQPTSNLYGTIGYFISNRNNIVDEYYTKAKKAIEKNKDERNLSLKIDEIVEIKDTKELISFLSTEKDKFNNEELKHFLTLYNNIYKKHFGAGAKPSSYDKFLIELKSLHSYTVKNKSQKQFFKLFTESLSQKIAGFNNEIKAIHTSINKIDMERILKNLKPYRKLILFIDGGLNAEKFKHYNEIDTSNFGNSFNTIFNSGGYLGTGINIGFGKNIHFGFKYTYSETSNFGRLTKTDFKLTQTSSNSTGQSLSLSDNITAYSGDYIELFSNKFNLELVWYKYLKAIDNNMSLTLYMENEKFNRWDIIPETTDLGITASFYKDKGKFMGGLYVEVPDWDNNLEDIKETPNYRDRHNRITFGIFGTYTFKTLFNHKLKVEDK